MKIKAKIIYKIDGNHPDIGDLPEKYWHDKTFTYESTYHMDPDRYYGFDHMIETIKENLLLIAGGGYNWKHIYDVKFEIEVVS